MQSTYDVKYGKIVERYSNYKKYNRPAMIIAGLGVAVPIGLLMTIAADDQPQALEFKIIAGIIFAIMIGIAAHYRKVSHGFLVPDEDILFMYSYELLMRLRAYSSNELDSEKAQAAVALNEVIDSLDSKWGILTKNSDKTLSAFDFIINPSTRLILSLKKVYLPILERGTKTEVIETISFFEQLANMADSPSDTRVREVIASARPVSEQEERKKPSLFSSKPIVKHSIVISIIATVSGAICFLLLSSFAHGDILPLVETSLTAAGVVSGIYFGLAMFLARKPTS